MGPQTHPFSLFNPLPITLYYSLLSQTIHKTSRLLNQKPRVFKFISQNSENTIPKPWIVSMFFPFPIVVVLTNGKGKWFPVKLWLQKRGTKLRVSVTKQAANAFGEWTVDERQARLIFVKFLLFTYCNSSWKKI